MKIAIIGSRDLSGSVSFKDMVEMTKKEILKLCPKGDCELVSGGSSWADFIAVVLRNELIDSSLTLYLPSRFEAGKFEFTKNGGNSWSTLNDLHDAFHKQTMIDSLDEMRCTSLLDRVKYEVYPGFLNRNDRIVENCDHLIALSHGRNKPDSPGTLYTWNKASEKNRIHIHIDK